MPADRKDINKSYTSFATEIVYKFTLHVARKSWNHRYSWTPLAMFFCRAEVFRGDSLTG